MNQFSLASVAELINNNDFSGDCLDTEVLIRAKNYLLAEQLDSAKALNISKEIGDLQQLVLEFNNSLTTSAEYLNLLYGLSRSLIQVNEESALLEVLIPYWQSQRGTTLAHDKPVDEFYYEFEMVTLWSLIAQALRSKKFSAANILKMRTIIRRYSNMPSFWLYLWDISGEEVKIGYTF